VRERRIQRLEELIKERVAEVLHRDMADPRLGLITVTRVRVDREVRTCKVYWSMIGDDKAIRLNERTLEHARGFIQHQVAAVLNTRTVPHVTFAFDESIAGAARIEAILKQIRPPASESEKQGRGEPSPGDGAEPSPGGGPSPGE
jgi:ribosome-binding factor A